ncbi:YjeF family C-terminal domain [Bacteriovorax sp. BAL6_X]|uniref:NAD(P)H-hydrate dehydratase n=1 Tax=Bacteriovorax sp. BAL6_X TaxID=1201290 RepID=UPI00038597F4|nr:NAD(P)H-hydrate dehydratase [Bacteriovorax sp. BAL6_X]EPZ50862.1 YjeF family C-terminal domain [Bacteriovorax sp. BAL6_X]
MSNDFPFSLLRKLPLMNKEVNKYSFGHVVVIGGNSGYAGAARLAAEGALRSGAGMVSVLTQKASVSGVLAGRPELMVRGIEANEKGIEHANAILKKATSVVLGPGLGRDEWGRFMWDHFCHLSHNKVVDADALWFLSQAQNPIKLVNAIITPHEGEAARLLNVPREEVSKHRLSSVKKIMKFSSTCVLKGHETLVASQSVAYENKTGNAILAMAGTGDILAGIIGSFLAQGLSLDEAACLGVWVHGRAADLLKESEEGIRGSVASDLFPYIRNTML